MFKNCPVQQTSWMFHHPHVNSNHVTTAVLCKCKFAHFLSKEMMIKTKQSAPCQQELLWLGFWTLPAVDHHRASVRRCRGFHSSYKGQQSGGVIGHPMLRPGCKVELTHLMLRGVSSLETQYTLALHVNHYICRTCVRLAVAFRPLSIQDTLPFIQTHSPPW